MSNFPFSAEMSPPAADFVVVLHRVHKVPEQLEQLQHPSQGPARPEAQAQTAQLRHPGQVRGCL